MDRDRVAMNQLNGWAGRFRTVHPSVWQRLPASRLARLVLYSLPVAFLAVFLFYPLLTILTMNLTPEGKLDLTPLGSLFSSRYHLRTIWFTIWQAVVSTALTLVLAASHTLKPRPPARDS